MPGDSSSCSVGADEVAAAIAAEADRPIEIIRNGSRGLYWLEPLVEVATPDGRLAYGPVTPDDVADLVTAGFLAGGPHRLALGPTEDIEQLRSQNRLVFARVGVVDPRSPADYRGPRRARRAPAGPDAWTRPRSSPPSRRRGCGAGAEPGSRPGIKWKTVLEAGGDLKFICCNADEGDSGTFADRMLLEGDPFLLIEGMLIAAWAVGAREGYVYVRSEYPDAVEALRRAIEAAYTEGWLGPARPRLRANVRPLREGRGRRLHLRRGDGRCSRASRGGGAWCGPSRRSRPSKDSSAARRCQQRPHPRQRPGDPGRRAPSPSPSSAPAGPGAPRCSSWRGTCAAAGSSRPPSASPSASWSRATAGARPPAGRCGPSRSAARSAPTCRRRSSPSRWTTRRSRRRAP